MFDNDWWTENFLKFFLTIGISKLNWKDCHSFVHIGEMIDSENKFCFNFRQKISLLRYKLLQLMPKCIYKLLSLECLILIDVQNKLWLSMATLDLSGLSLVRKFFGVEIFFGLRIFGTQMIWFQNSFGSQKVWAKKDFGYKI